MICPKERRDRHRPNSQCRHRDCGTDDGSWILRRPQRFREVIGPPPLYAINDDKGPGNNDADQKFEPENTIRERESGPRIDESTFFLNLDICLDPRKQFPKLNKAAEDQTLATYVATLSASQHRGCVNRDDRIDDDGGDDSGHHYS